MQTHPPWCIAVIAIVASSGCADPGDDTAVAFDPVDAPRAVVDRFSDDAATMFRRSAMPGLPGPGEPIDFDADFLVDGLGPSGQPISYYSLDVQVGRVMPVHRIVDGQGVPVPGQLPIVPAIPGDPDYADFWQYVDHEAPSDYVANSINDAARLLAEDWPQTRSFEALNRPLVPEGSTALRRVVRQPDASSTAWIHGEIVTFSSFDEAPIPILGEFVPYSLIFVCFDVPPSPEGAPQSGFCAEADGRTHNVLESVPGDALYSPLWDVRVYDAADFDAVLDLDGALAASAIADLAMVNCPLAGP